MSVYVLVLLIGVVAGLRTMTAPAVVSWAGLVAGAIAGTLGGYEFRTRLAATTGGRDLPIALLEDAIAIGGRILIVMSFS
jgi:uncharacterized membrane protein